MATKNALMAVGICMIFFGMPAQAGQSDNPQERRDLVEYNHEVQQNANGPSGFGTRISERATDKNDSDEFRNFGDYLNQMTDGPVTKNVGGGAKN